MSTQSNRHPPFWGLKLSTVPGTHVLVLEDKLSERQPVLEQLLDACEVTWAADIAQAHQALESHGPFDMYCMDYDLGEVTGGWMVAGQLIRERDPRSIAKIVLVHSANIDARRYFSLFPAAIFIQWDVLATIVGVRLVDDQLIEALLAETDPDASVDQLRNAVMNIRKRDTWSNQP
jgi:CheY-like chemotaxis protein